MRLNRANRRDSYRLAVAGIDKYLATEPSLPIRGTSPTPLELKQALQGHIDDVDQADVARARWTDTVTAQRTSERRTMPMLSALKTFVTLKFGPDAVAVLADFGFTPAKQVQKTVETKKQAVEKSRATRTARHTMGKKQKKAVKGTVPSSGAAP
jgi:hypothetical protein